MKKATCIVFSVLLTAFLALTMPPSLAVAQMGEEAMGEERIVSAEGSANAKETAREEPMQAQSDERAEEQAPLDDAGDTGLATEGEDGLAPSSGGGAGSITTQSGSADNNVNCKFSIDGNGYLVIGPETGTSCTLCSIPAQFLYDNISTIKGLRFEKGVKAHEDFNLFSACSDNVSVDTGNGQYGVFILHPYLENLDFANLDLSPMRKAVGTFAGLRTKGVLEVSMDTSKVTDMSFMFAGFEGRFHHKEYNTANVTNMTCMFANSALRNLEVGFSNTANVTDMRWMFSNMKDLKDLNISCMNNANADCSNMFHATTGINKIVVGNGWDTSKPGAFPESPSGKWWSADAKKWMTVQEIASQRKNVADTYTSYRGFPDLDPTAWYLGVVSQATDLGFINGYDNGNFGPNDKITRGQVATILWSMASKPAPSDSARKFPDVEAGKYYTTAISWAAQVGVVSGNGDGSFGPNNPITREQLAAMICNYARAVARMDTTGSASDYKDMKDAKAVSEWAESSMGWCYRNKIISGTGDGCLNPQGNAARAEAAKMIVSLYNMVRG